MNSNSNQIPTKEDFDSNLALDLSLEYDQLIININNISDIGDNLFYDDLESLKLLMYSYQYVHRMLEKYKEEMPLDLREQFLHQKEKILPAQMLKALKTMESHCKIQLELNEKYEEPLFLGSKRNTELILQRLRTQFTRNKKSPFTGLQWMKYISKFLIHINAMLGRDITVSEVDVKAFTCVDITLEQSNDWKHF